MELELDELELLDDDLLRGLLISIFGKFHSLLCTNLGGSGAKRCLESSSYSILNFSSCIALIWWSYA
jgi:hypothetical protein